jgi:hypothetical protein
MLSYQETESCQKKQSCEYFHFFLFGKKLSEILEDDLVNELNNFHYTTRNTEVRLKCTDKIILAINWDVLVLSIRLILRNISDTSRKMKIIYLSLRVT